MKFVQKGLTFFVVLVLAAAICVIPALATGETGVITVLYTNDVHTYIDQPLRYSTVAAYRNSLDNVLLVDAGDHLQGTAYGAMDEGETITRLMNAAGYDVATLGNHEFDYGMDGCAAAVERAEFPYVSCNFYHETNGETGDLVLAPYQVFEVSGRTIAFVGITTPETLTSTAPAYFQDENGNYIYGIAGGVDGALLYAAVQRAIDAAAREADIIIALGHLGDDPSSDPWNSEDVIAHTTGLDAFIDGHSHSTVEMKTVFDKAGEPVVLSQTGSYFAALGEMTIAADGTVTTRLLTADDLEAVTPDADVQALEEQWMTELESRQGTVIGTFTEEMTNFDAEGNRLVRRQETNTGDFCADALYYLFDSMGLDVDVAVMNGGGIRNSALTGEISYLTCQTIHPFGNVACLQTVTGQQLLDMLEWSVRLLEEDGSVEDGSFLHVSGLKYTVDLSIPSTVQSDDRGVWTGGPTGEYRVTEVLILDPETGTYVPLDPAADYNLAGYNYTLRDLGGGFAMLSSAVNVLDYVMEDYLVLAEYVRSFPGGVVTGYEAPQGRITFRTGGEAAEDVPAAAPEGQTYVVANGDCLWSIAEHLYGCGSLWGKLYEANLAVIGSRPELIYAGQCLILPAIT